MSPASSSRNYSARTIKILWGRAAGRCAVPTCRVELLVDETEYDPIVVIGDIAHMAAASDDGPRADESLSARDRDQYENLILLCKNCHTRIDGQKHTNPVAVIRKLKADHEAWVRTALPERGKSTRGWQPVILQGDQPIDVEKAVEALSPDFASTDAFVLTCSYNSDWTVKLSELRAEVYAIQGSGDSFDKRYAVFPVAPVSACIAVGYLFTNRPHVLLFQHHRESSSWTWPGQSPPRDLTVDGFPETPDGSASEVAACFHLSAAISRDNLPPPFVSGKSVVHIRVPQPSVRWLVAPVQLDWIGDAAGSVFEQLGSAFSNARKWHLFYAGPAPGAVKIGQQLNPTMCPEVQLYEFSRASTPRYQPSILLKPR
jgi:CBASS immunity sensor of nucleotide second messenger signals